MKLKMTGIKELQKKLKSNVAMNDVKRVVRQNGAELQKKMVEKAVFKGHYEGNEFVKPSGNLKRSISGPVISDGGLTATVEPTAEYASYVEYGTRFMAAQPYVRPAFNEQKQQFKRDMKNLVR